MSLSDGKIAAIILAAGSSTRMKGSNKLLSSFDGKILIRHVTEHVLAAGFDEVVVVTGFESENIVQLLNDLPVVFVYNNDHKTGLSSSLKAGIGSLSDKISAAMIVLGDMPAIRPEHITKMIAAFLNSNDPIFVRASHNGRMGNPVILPSEVFSQINLLTGDIGARQIIENSSYPVLQIEIGEAASIDVDTPAALAQAGGIIIQ